MTKSWIYFNALFFFSALFICHGIKCNGQISDTTLLKIPEYHVDPCISKLFVSVVKSNSQYYDVDTFFYSVTFKRANKALYMNISAEKWTAAPYLDYGGIMKLKHYSFLLRGDLDQDSIFTKTNSVPLKILLRKEGADSNSRFFPEPSLQGTYYICKPMPINLEIYTKGSIKNFDMKIRSQN